jgi:hypothetical protein
MQPAHHYCPSPDTSWWPKQTQGNGSQQFWELYGMFNIRDLSFDGIYLPALVKQLPKMLALFLVMTFGSCLDVAAIQVAAPATQPQGRAACRAGTATDCEVSRITITCHRSGPEVLARASPCPPPKPIVPTSF